MFGPFRLNYQPNACEVWVRLHSSSGPLLGPSDRNGYGQGFSGWRPISNRCWGSSSWVTPLQANIAMPFHGSAAVYPSSLVPLTSGCSLRFPKHEPWHSLDSGLFNSPSVRGSWQHFLDSFRLLCNPWTRTPLLLLPRACWHNRASEDLSIFRWGRVLPTRKSLIGRTRISRYMLSKFLWAVQLTHTLLQLSFRMLL